MKRKCFSIASTLVWLVILIINFKYICIGWAIMWSVLFSAFWLIFTVLLDTVLYDKDKPETKDDNEQNN